jgi:hypothetical protein
LVSIIVIKTFTFVLPVAVEECGSKVRSVTAREAQKLRAFGSELLRWIFGLMDTTEAFESELLRRILGLMDTTEGVRKRTAEVYTWIYGHK